MAEEKSDFVKFYEAATPEEEVLAPGEICKGCTCTDACKHINEKPTSCSYKNRMIATR